MSERRISGASRSTGESPVGSPKDLHRFIGLSLSGGKSDKACIAVIEYYSKQNRIFLVKLIEKIKSEENISADQKIHEIIEAYGPGVDYLCVDAPLSLPICMECKLSCPGIEACQEPHIKWMWNFTNAKNKKKKPKKLFTPYTQRSVEMFLSTELDEPFIFQHCLGSNVAPLTARAHFISRRLRLPKIEVFPKISIWRIGRGLKVMKRHLRFHRHSVGGDESRQAILKTLSEHNVVFLYQQDYKLMIENNHAFEAFICALTGFLKFSNQTEDKPENFPKNESWIEIPKEKLKWD